ncbi:MAG TPA: hypothetical protein VGF05_18080 [Bryobacteraceae bacterium]|jgi:hypothetical protein
MSSQSAATAAEGRPRRPRLSRRQREYGFDVSDQKFSDPRYWMGDDIASFLLLEELNPGDPGELSGAKLVLCGDLGEEDSAVLAEVADHHRIGFLPGVTAKELAQLTLQGIHDPDTVLEAKLGDAEDMSCVRFKGCVLHFEGGPTPSLTLYLGEHCFGIARGSDLIEFLNRVLRRTGGTLDVEASLPNVVCISKGRRQPVAAAPPAEGGKQ